MACVKGVRQIIEFEPLAAHAQSGMPLIKEFRLFVLDGQIISLTPYWEEGDYGDDRDGFPPIETFSPVIQKMQSRFFTLDVARKKDGTWNIVEPGDGQVAGLPGRADVQGFYQALAGL